MMRAAALETKNPETLASNGRMRKSMADVDAPIPDLLHAVPMARIDFESTKLGVQLAFASGVAGVIGNRSACATARFWRDCW